MKLNQKTSDNTDLPPYWNGDYSNTWKWTGDKRIGPNATEYEME